MVVAGGVLVATGVGGPAGMMLISGGADAIIQKATTGKVNWSEVAVSTAAGALGGAGGAALAARVGAKGLTSAVMVGAASGAAGGGAGSGTNYLTGPGPHTAAGLLQATGSGAASGAVLGGAGGAAGHGIAAGGSKLLCKISGNGCFVAGTEILLADGSSKSIEDIETDDEVMAYSAETDQTEKRRVVRSYVHEEKPTYDIVVEDGEQVTATSEHPFMVEGRGYVPVDELEKGDLLVRADGSTIEVLSINATGETATVHNFEVEGLHNYYVQAGGHWLLVHNTCNVPNPKPARFITTGEGSIIDRESISRTVSVQKQARHLLDHPKYENASYFHEHDEAQRVLDSFQDGTAEVLGRKGNDIVVRTPDQGGFNHNPRYGYLHQPTDVHFIKGSTSVSVVPTTPGWRPR